MKFKALITLFVLGTSTAAMAAPNAPGFAPEVRDHRMPPRHDRYERWQELATGHLVRGRDVIAVNAAKIDKLKLQLVGPGSLYVEKLVVSFGNGRAQTIAVNQWVTARNANGAVIDLAGKNRKITSITVIGRGQGSGFRAGASFKLLAL